MVVPIPIEDIKCLRGHLDAIEKIIQKHGYNSGSNLDPVVVQPKQTKSEKIKKYKELIGSGERVKKPNHLKK